MLESHKYRINMQPAQVHYSSLWLVWWVFFFFCTTKTMMENGTQWILHCQLKTNFHDVIFLSCNAQCSCLRPVDFIIQHNAKQTKNENEIWHSEMITRDFFFFGVWSANNNSERSFRFKGKSKRNEPSTMSFLYNFLFASNEWMEEKNWLHH